MIECLHIGKVRYTKKCCDLVYCEDCDPDAEKAATCPHGTASSLACGQCFTELQRERDALCSEEKNQPSSEGEMSAAKPYTLEEFARLLSVPSNHEYDRHQATVEECERLRAEVEALQKGSEDPVCLRTECQNHRDLLVAEVERLTKERDMARSAWRQEQGRYEVEGTARFAAEARAEEAEKDALAWLPKLAAAQQDNERLKEALEELKAELNRTDPTYDQAVAAGQLEKPIRIYPTFPLVMRVIDAALAECETKGTK